MDVTCGYLRRARAVPERDVGVCRDAKPLEDVNQIVVREFRRDGRAAGAGRSEPLPLSPREEMVLRLVAWGNSNKEIASQLSITVKTVETHKTNAMHKLGLENRLAVVRFAVLQGWLRDDA